MNLNCVYPVLATILLVVPMAFGTDMVIHKSAADTDYFPEDEWRTSAPELQNIDPDILHNMLEYYQTNNVSVDSIVIVKNGYVIMEEYPSTYERNSTHQIFSCTKSITSTLFGIAIDKGYIDGVNESVLEFFKDRSIENMDTRKDSLTIKHLLTMTAGFDWTELYRESESDFDQMTRTSDWIQYVLDRPMESEPGLKFVYNTGASHLLSAILQIATGITMSEFAQAHLFTRLGIHDFEWSEDSKGITNGGTQLRLRPLDMAKIGYLFLRSGQWAGEQIISRGWIDEATSSFVNTTLREAPELIESIGYGYQWWVHSELGAYSAFGWGGQSIIVVPEHDIVAVVTARSSDPSIYASRILTQWILPAAGEEVTEAEYSDPLALYIFGGSAGLFFGLIIVTIPLPIALILVKELPEEPTEDS
ncbi:MAG: serine hydrolase domain-containing protein [Candidatus Thorarchaeota archaeon]